MALDTARMLDWNDLRYFLAVSRHGSTLAAARALRTSQTTVARRIGALEEALSLPLFEKRQAGYALTPTGEELVKYAEQVELSASGFAEAAAAVQRGVSGTVKLTVEEIFATTLLAPMLLELRDLHREIQIELDTFNGVRDLGAGEADIGLRNGGAPQQSGIFGRRICDDDWAFYCGPSYAERHGVPDSIQALRDHLLLGGGGDSLWRHYQAYLQRVGLEDRVAMRYDSSVGLLSGVRTGLGIAVLPCIVADFETDLIKCFPPRKDHGREMWLVTHDRVRHVPAVRTVIDFLYARLMRHVRRLETKRAAA